MNSATQTAKEPPFTVERFSCDDVGMHYYAGLETYSKFVCTVDTWKQNQISAVIDSTLHDLEEVYARIIRQYAGTSHRPTVESEEDLLSAEHNEDIHDQAKEVLYKLFEITILV